MTQDAIDAAAKHLRETMQAGKKLTPWEATPKATKKKWLALAEGTLRAGALTASMRDEGEVVAWRVRVNENGRVWYVYTERLPYTSDDHIKVLSEPEPLFAALRRNAEHPVESEPVGYLFELCYSHKHDWWSGPMYSECLPKAEDVRNVRPLYAAQPAAHTGTVETIAQYCDVLDSCVETFWCLTKEGTDDRLLADGALDATKGIRRALSAPTGEGKAPADSSEQPGFTYYECPECGFDAIYRADYEPRSTSCPICAGYSGHDVGMNSRTARVTDKPEGKDARTASPQGSRS